MKKIAIALILFLPFLNSCKKNKNVVPASSTDIYVVGALDVASSPHFAVYWKNGTQVTLTGGSGTPIALSIANAGSDVYIAGDVFSASGNFIAAYWKNGVLTKLSDSTTNYYAGSICTSGNDVYVSGRGPNGPVYWKNGEMVNIPNAVTALVSGIAVSGGDVYLAGTNNGNATYWKNGTAIALTSGTEYATAEGIAIDGNDVYVSGTMEGFLYNTAVYWKNGVQTNLTDHTVYSEGGGIAVAGGNVYVAGLAELLVNYDASPETFYMSYWKNGVWANPEAAGASSSGTSAGAITINGTDVYIAGSVGNIPVYWKNGSLVKLGSTFGVAYGITVVGN
jgi:hypothetical protein